jgi:hypothetical protein
MMRDTQSAREEGGSAGFPGHGAVWRTLDEWTLTSEPGNERQAIARSAIGISRASAIGLCRCRHIASSASNTSVSRLSKSHS